MYKNRSCAGPSQRDSLLYIAQVVYFPLDAVVFIWDGLVLCLLGKVSILIIKLLTVSVKTRLSVLCSRAQRLGFSGVSLLCQPAHRQALLIGGARGRVQGWKSKISSCWLISCPDSVAPEVVHLAVAAGSSPSPLSESDSLHSPRDIPADS